MNPDIITAGCNQQVENLHHKAYFLYKEIYFPDKIPKYCYQEIYFPDKVLKHCYQEIIFPGKVPWHCYQDILFPDKVPWHCYQEIYFPDKVSKHCYQEIIFPDKVSRLSDQYFQLSRLIMVFLYHEISFSLVEKELWNKEVQKKEIEVSQELHKVLQRNPKFKLQLFLLLLPYIFGEVLNLIFMLLNNFFKA